MWYNSLEEVNKWCFAVINLMLLDYFKHFHLMERVTLSSSNSEIHLKHIFMPFHRWNSVFSHEFWWWLWFEWEWKAEFPHSSKTLQAGTYLGFALLYLCLCCKSTTEKQLRENKTEVKVVLKQCKYQIWGVSKHDDSKLSDVIFFSLFCEMKFLQKKTWLCKVLLFQQISFLWWKVVPSQLFPVKLATYLFLGQIYSFAQRVSL